MLTVACAPSKVRWLISRAMHYLQLINSLVEKKETIPIG
jgi:hypothetical protein